MAGVPWIYEPPKSAIQINSPYNRKPKGHKYQEAREDKIAEIRKNISLADNR